MVIIHAFIFVYIFLYMLAIAGLMAGPNGLKYFEGTHMHVYLGCNIG